MPQKIQSLFIVLFGFLLVQNAHSQIGGRSTYQFLDMMYSSRNSGLGNNVISVKDDDINVAITNPSLITENLAGKLALSYANYFSDVKYGYVSYGHSFDQIGSYVGSLQFINYGDFKGMSEEGQETGHFSAADYLLTLGWGRCLDSNFSIGANLKTIYSHLEDYSSFGLAVDLSASYHNKAKGFTASLLFRNIGKQIKTYNQGTSEALPFDIQLGASKKLAHVPLRFYFMLTHLQKWDLTYYDPNDPDNQIDPFTGEASQKDGLSEFSDKAFRHVVLGAEFNMSKYLAFRVGYNYKRRQELSLPVKPASVGFSWGVNLNISRFQIGFSRSIYHLSKARTFLTLTTDLRK